MEHTCVYITETVDVERRRGANYCEARPAHGSGTGLGGRSRFVPSPGAKLATGTASDRPGGAYDGLIAFDACMHMLSVPIRRQRAVTNQIEVSAVRMLITRPNYCTVVLD